MVKRGDVKGFLQT